MDLLPTTASASPTNAQSPANQGHRAFSSSPRRTDSRDGGQGASSSNTRQADSASTRESGPFDALLGGCVQENSQPVKEEPRQGRPLPMLGAGGPAPRSQGAAVDGSSGEIAWLPGRQTAAGESWSGLPDAEVARGLKGQASQDPDAASPQVEGASLTRQRHAAESEAHRSDRVRGESAEHAFLSKEGGSGSGETQEAGPRLMLSRMDALKGMEQAGEQQGGELKPAGHTGQGENVASLAGKDGTAWKQEVPIDLPARPAPPPVTSTQTAPAHVAQAGSGGTFRIFRDAVHMRIQDEELGPMRWHIQLRGGTITAEAIVETSRVQELLQNHQDVLEAKLNAMGVEVEEFDVSVGEGSQRFAAFSDRDGSGHTGRSDEDLPHDVIMEPGMSNLQRHTDRGLDLYA